MLFRSGARSHLSHSWLQCYNCHSLILLGSPFTASAMPGFFQDCHLLLSETYTSPPKPHHFLEPVLASVTHRGVRSLNTAILLSIIYSCGCREDGGLLLNVPSLSHGASHLLICLS